MMDIRGKLAAAMSLNMLMWLIMLLLFAGLLGCAAALYMALAIVWPHAVAMLMASLALLAVCAILALCLKRALRPPQPAQAPQPQPPSREPDIEQAIEDNIRSVMGERATDWTRQHTELAIFGAVATGVLLGASPRLRRIVMRATEPVLSRALSRVVKDRADKQ